MSEGVWVSLAPGSSDTIVSVEADILDVQTDAALKYIRRNNRGEALSRQCFPVRINIDPDVDNPDSLNTTRHLFQGGYWFVSEKCADVLRSFDLGGGGLYHVEVLQADRMTPVKGAYFSLNFGNTKQAFVPQTSNVLGELPGMDEYRQLYPIAKDGDVSVSRDAFVGPDIWIDPFLLMGFFVSGRLAAGLKSAGCDKPFKLRSCRIV